MHRDLPPHALSTNKCRLMQQSMHTAGHGLPFWPAGSHKLPRQCSSLLFSLTHTQRAVHTHEPIPPHTACRAVAPDSASRRGNCEHQSAQDALTGQDKARTGHSQVACEQARCSRAHIQDPYSPCLPIPQVTSQGVRGEVNNAEEQKGIALMTPKPRHTCTLHSTQQTKG